MKRKISLLFCILLTALIITPTAFSVNNQIFKSENKEELKTVDRETKIQGVFANIFIEGNGFIVKEGPLTFFDIAGGKINIDFVIGQDYTLESGKGFIFGLNSEPNDEGILHTSGFVIFIHIIGI